MRREIRGMYMVQRLMIRDGLDSRDRKGVDKYFTMEYMGSSEFEGRAKKTTLEATRARMAQEPEWEPTRLKVGKYEFWYVGPASETPKAFEWLSAGIAGERVLSLEPSYLRDALKIEDRFPSLSVRTIGWWPVFEGEREWSVHFALFLEKEQAKAWLKGLKNQ